MVKRFKFFTGEDTSFEEMMEELHFLDNLPVVGIHEIVGQPTVTPRFWTTGDGTNILITELSTAHIDNILNCLNDRGNMRIPDIYEGFAKQRWIEIMMDELNRRNNEGL
jgi:hypothetical protein